MTRMLRTAWGLIALLPIICHAESDYRLELLGAARSQPDASRGAMLFKPCTACHGPQGAGTLDGGVPRLAGQHASVLAKQLVDYRHGRRWHFRMEHFADRHHLPDARAIADVAAYVHQLPVSPPGIGAGELLGHGARLYITAMPLLPRPHGRGECEAADPADCSSAL